MQTSNGSKSNWAMANERIRLENPFTLKVAQVFTGFGVGCGFGIGVGSPINFGALPIMGDVMSAARGATNALYGVNRHINGALRNMGAGKLQAGVGCGIGFGRGFGVGIALKPGVMQKVQAFILQMMMNMMTKFGVAPSLPMSQNPIAVSLQSGTSLMSGLPIQNPLGSITQLATGVPDQASQGLHGYGNMAPNSTHGSSSSKASEVDPFSRTEKVLSSFLQNPILKENETKLSEEAGRLRSENNMLQMVLKHQQIIEELVKENEKLHQILVEDLKVSPSKLQANISTENKSPCTDCFECRRKQRRSR